MLRSSTGAPGKTVKKIITDKAAPQLPARATRRHVFVEPPQREGQHLLVDMQTLTEIEKYDVPAAPTTWRSAPTAGLWATARFARKVQVVDLTRRSSPLHPRSAARPRRLVHQPRPGCDAPLPHRPARPAHPAIPVPRPAASIHRRTAGARST